MDEFVREFLYYVGYDDLDNWSIEKLEGNGVVVRHSSGQQSTITKYKEYQSNLSTALFNVARSVDADDPQTDIDELIKQYEAEDCDFSDNAFVSRILKKQLSVMPDGIARAALAVLLRSQSKPQPVQQEVLHEFPYTDYVLKTIRNNNEVIAASIQAKVGGYVNVPSLQVIKRRYATKKGTHSRVYMAVASDAVDHVLVKTALSEALASLNFEFDKPIKLCFTSVNAFSSASTRTFQFRVILEHDTDYGDYLV